MFKELVNALKLKQGFKNSGEQLNATNLQTALEKSEVKQKIKELLDKEFGVNVEERNINATAGSEGGENTNTVKVTIGTGGGAGNDTGSSVVNIHRNNKLFT